MSALSLQIAPKIYSLRKRTAVAEVDIENSKNLKVEPKVPDAADVTVERKSTGVKVEQDMPQSVVSDPDSEDISVKSSAENCTRVKVEPEIVTSCNVRSKKRKISAVVSNESADLPPKIAHVDQNAIVLGQTKGRISTRNIRQIKQTKPSVLGPKQIIESGDEVLDSDEADFRRRQAELKLQQRTPKENVEVLIKDQKKEKAANRKSAKGSKSDLQKQKQQSRSEWFDPQKFDNKRIRHPPVVKKALPPDAEIFCGKCNEIFDDVSKLSVHEKNCYVGRRYKCPHPRCSHVNAQKSLLHQHIKALHFDDPFKCSICSETFVYKKSLDKHMKRVHKVGPQTFKYVCPECGKGTDDKTEFSIHLDRHENLKRYSCNVCGQAFYAQSQLTHHLKHSCVSSTNTSSSFECSVCGKNYKTEDRYREHFRSEHINTENPMPYFCEDCISWYYTESGFKRHQHNCKGII